MFKVGSIKEDKPVKPIIAWLQFKKECSKKSIDLDDYKIENEEMRKGYRLGIFNQRGVRWIDPEGKPELQLAEDYKKCAEIVESMGYAKYAEMLHLISDDYIREAKDNIREHQLEIEAQKREYDD